MLRVVNRAVRAARTSHDGMGSVLDVVRTVTGCVKPSGVVRRLRDMYPQDVPRMQPRQMALGRPTPCLPPDELRQFAELLVRQRALGRKRLGAHGVVYIVTSPLLAACKIGMWRGTETSLRERYRTVYGTEARIETYHVADCRAAERSVHEACRAHRVSNELYALQAIATARDVLRPPPRRRPRPV
jgi:hypothetical protein